MQFATKSHVSWSGGNWSRENWSCDTKSNKGRQSFVFSKCPLTQLFHVFVYTLGNYLTSSILACPQAPLGNALYSFNPKLKVLDRSYRLFQNVNYQNINSRNINSQNVSFHLKISKCTYPLCFEVSTHSTLPRFCLHFRELKYPATVDSFVTLIRLQSSWIHRAAGRKRRRWAPLISPVHSGQWSILVYEY